VHFDDDPVPQSVAVAVQAGLPEETRSAFRRGALVFTDSLRTFDSLGLIPIGSLASGNGAPKPTSPRAEKPPDPPALPVVRFSSDHGRFNRGLSGWEQRGDGPARPPLREALQTAPHSLQARPRGRAILALLAGPGPEEAAIEIAHAGFGPPAPAVVKP